MSNPKDIREVLSAVLKKKGGNATTSLSGLAVEPRQIAGRIILQETGGKRVPVHAPPKHCVNEFGREAFYLFQSNVLIQSTREKIYMTMLAGHVGILARERGKHGFSLPKKLFLSKGELAIIAEA